MEPIVYASLPPGTLPDAEFVQFTNTASGRVVNAAVAGGGFDPVPVPAAADDSLAIRVQLRDGQGERLFHAKVPPRRPPVIVRSDPSVGRRDVPLNARMLVVFSEPLADAVVTDSAVQLSAGDVRVSGTVAFADDSRLTLAFTPSSPLSPGTGYTLNLTSAIRDRDGDRLESSVGITFATAAPTGDGAAGAPPGGTTLPGVASEFTRIGVDPASDNRAARLMLSTDGFFALEYIFPASEYASEYTVRHRGFYTFASGGLRLEVTDLWDGYIHWPYGELAALGTARGDTLHLQYLGPFTDWFDEEFVLTRGAMPRYITRPEALAGAGAMSPAMHSVERLVVLP